jgi:hypothetical protein
LARFPDIAAAEIARMAIDWREWWYVHDWLRWFEREREESGAFHAMRQIDD